MRTKGSNGAVHVTLRATLSRFRLFAKAPFPRPMTGKWIFQDDPLKNERALRTRSQALAAHVRLIVWCKSCNHGAEPDIATQGAPHGSAMPVINWARLLAVC